MTHFIDIQFWQESLSKSDWYIILANDFKRLEKLAEQEQDPAKHKLIKREVYEAVETALSDNVIPLAKTGPNLDKQRRPINTIVIHHSKNPPGMTLERLNAMQLLRIYGRYFADPTDDRERSLKGKPIWSGHFYNGQQVFWAYHWLIRKDGKREHILKDDYIGWHAGNWGINTSSLGVCIDDDLSYKEPSKTVINSIVELLNTQYATIDHGKIVGHCDVNEQTVCPGYLFHKSWQKKLIDHMDTDTYRHKIGLAS